MTEQKQTAGMFAKVCTFSEPLSCPSCGSLETMVMVSGDEGVIHGVGGCLNCGNVWEGSCKIVDISLESKDNAVNALIKILHSTPKG